MSKFAASGLVYGFGDFDPTTTYTPTVWVNNTSPPISAANLNKLTDELRRQAATQLVANTLPTWVNNAAPAISDATDLNEMERVAQVVASSLALTYTPTAWTLASPWPGNPARNAANLNKLEAQAQANRTAIQNPPPLGDKFAATTANGGSDLNPGTLASPYATLQKLANSLLPGQTGMMRGGTYAPPFTFGTGEPHQGNLSVFGTAGQRITITNYPGERVTIQGYFIQSGAFMTIRNLHFDITNIVATGGICGTASLGLQPTGTDNIWEYNELTFVTPGLKGSALINYGSRNIYRYNTIHDVGGCRAFDHGIYIAGGADVEVYGNWIWNNDHGWGVQVYPNPVRALVHSNVMDNCGGGVTISDLDSGSTNNCDVYNNVMMNMGTTGANEFSVVVNSAGAGLSGQGCTSVATNNKFRDNDCFNNPDGVQTPGHGANVLVSGNITSDPLVVNAVTHDYRLQGGSPAAGYGLPSFVVGPTV